MTYTNINIADAPERGKGTPGHVRIADVRLDYGLVSVKSNVTHYRAIHFLRASHHDRIQLAI